MEEGEKKLWKALTFVDDMKSLYREVTPVLSGIFSIPNCETRATIYKYNHSNETLDAILATGAGSDEVKKIETKVGEGLAGSIFYEKKPALIEDVIRHPKHRDVSRATGFKIGPAMLVPMYYQNNSYGLGLIYVMRNEGAQPFTDEDLTHLIALSYPVRHVIFQDLETDVERNAKFVKLAREMAHDVKNVLVGMTGGMDILDMAIQNKNWESVITARGLIDRSSEKINTSILDMLDFSRARYPNYEVCDINLLLGEAVEISNERAKKAGVAIDYSGKREIAIPVDRERIFRVYMNLLLNSINALEFSEGEKYIITGIENLAEYARTDFKDNGPGIPKEKIPLLFQEYSGVIVGGSKKSNRIGLPVAYKIVKEHGGDIKIESEPGKGTRFMVLLPKKPREKVIQ